MRRVNVLSALVGFGGVLLLAGGSPVQGQPPGAPLPPGAIPTGRPVVAVFNPSTVLREYGRAKYQVYLLDKKRIELSKDMMAWRSEYIKRQQELQAATDPTVKEQIQKRMVDLARMIEDKDREINKALNEDATRIISQLYDDIKAVVDKAAEVNGYQVVLVDPGFAAADEQSNAMIQELKRKLVARSFFAVRNADVAGVVIRTLGVWYPLGGGVLPGVQIFVARPADLTGVVVRTLNAWYPAQAVGYELPDTGQNAAPKGP